MIIPSRKTIHSFYGDLVEIIVYGIRDSVECSVCQYQAVRTRFDEYHWFGIEHFMEVDCANCGACYCVRERFTGQRHLKPKFNRPLVQHVFFKR